MPTPKIYPAKFINLDVELQSSLNLSPIAVHFDKSVTILTSDFFQDNFFLCMEPSLCKNVNTTVYHCTEYMLNLLEQLPPAYSELMNSCTSRVFDFGFDGGFKDNNRLNIELTPKQIARIAALQITIRITIYPYHPDRVL